MIKLFSKKACTSATLRWSGLFSQNKAILNTSKEFSTTMSKSPSKLNLLTKATNENLVNSFKRFKWSHLNEKDPNSLKLELDYEVLGKSIFYIYESDSYELDLVDRFLSIKGVSLC